MAEFRKSAVKITQGKRPVFLAFLAVRDLLAEGFYRIDRLDIRESTGIQRILDEKRAKSFCKDMLAAHEKGQAILPTSVFFATGGSVGYNENKGELFFDSTQQAGVCPLDVVDGQHRIEGLKMAAAKEDTMLDFPVAAVIAPNLTEPEKMLQFVTVNTKQRTVDPGVAQHIVARFTKMRGVENLPYIPGWLSDSVEQGDDDKALVFAKALNNNEKSPWRGRIQFADEPRALPRHTVKQAAFCKAIKKHIFTAGHPLGDVAGKEKQLRVLINFWTAVEKIFVGTSGEGDQSAATVVFKTIGMEFFFPIFHQALSQLSLRQDYTVAAMEKCILSARDNLSPEIAGTMSPDFWKSGSDVSKWSNSGAARAALQFVDALSQAGDNDN